MAAPTVPDVLPDVLGPGLRVVFCGSAAGAASARVGAYYAGPGNMFWPTLHRVGLTPRLMEPAEFRTVLRYGIGLTDLCKTESGADADLSRQADDAAALTAKIERHRPAVLAFNGKRAARVFLAAETLDYGEHARRIGGTAIHVLPSTSGAARRWWEETFWRRVADAVCGAREAARG
ncbi:MAG: mismatch-specific DNA-glycosylase [Rhodospirillales bacterium]|nr:mismatch-specific DNA-glycosylase [Rhodospirillales bacterium]